MLDDVDVRGRVEPHGRRDGLLAFVEPALRVEVPRDRAAIEPGSLLEPARERRALGRVGEQAAHATTPFFENTAAQRSLTSSANRIALVRIEPSYSFAVRQGTSSDTGETSQPTR